MTPYLLFPNNDQDLRDRIFSSPYGFLRTALQERGIDLHTYDQGNLRTARKVLCFNHRPDAYAQCRAAGLGPDQLVLFLMEPRPVIPTQYTPKVWNRYGQVFTFLDNLVDNKKFFKMLYPQGQETLAQQPTWSDRKYLTLMNGNKYSYVTNELYSLRRRAIRYFETSQGFDLYGVGWNQNGALNLGAAIQAARSGRWFRYALDVLYGWRRYPRYQGLVDDKRATIAQYRFAIAVENEEKTQGYITEKIFDCLFSGTVPIYLGADNITDYLPAETFIDLRQFRTLTDLDHRLQSMTEAEWQTYHDAGQAFLRSPEFQPWTPAQVFGKLAEKL